MPLVTFSFTIHVFSEQGHPAQLKYKRGERISELHCIDNEKH